MAIYKVTQGDTTRLISAANQASARSHAARSTIKVKVATVAEAIELSGRGIKVEESGVNQDQVPLLTEVAGEQA